jgi:hypothetical protein
MFNPKDGVPAWKRVYDAIHARDYGEKIRNDELKLICADYANWRQAIYKATKKMEENDQKTLRVVRNAGYIVALPNEHTNLATGRIVRSRRQLKKGKRTIEATNLPLLTPVQKADLIATSTKISQILRFVNKRKVESEPKAKAEKDEIQEHLSEIDINLKRIRNMMKKKRVAT